MSPEEYKAALLTLIVNEVQKALVLFNETYVMPLEKEYDELQEENERLKRRMRVLEQNLSKSVKSQNSLSEERVRYRDLASRLKQKNNALSDRLGI